MPFNKTLYPQSRVLTTLCDQYTTLIEKSFENRKNLKQEFSPFTKMFSMLSQTMP